MPDVLVRAVQQLPANATGNLGAAPFGTRVADDARLAAAPTIPDPVREVQSPAATGSRPSSDAPVAGAAIEVPQRLQSLIKFDTKAERFVYSGVDPETGEVVTQYPSPETLRRLALDNGYSELSLDFHV